MAKQYTNRRLRNKGGLKTLFLAAALFTGPANINSTDSAVGLLDAVKDETHTSFSLNRSYKERQDWLSCRHSRPTLEGSSALNNLLNKTLSTLHSEETRDLLSYIHQNGLHFCGVVDNRIANKYDSETNMITVKTTSDQAVNILNTLHAATAHKYGRFTYDPAYKMWDYHSQLAFAVSTMMRARAETALIAQELVRQYPEYRHIMAEYEREFSQLYKTYAEDKSLAIKNYIRKSLKKKNIYQYYAPQIMTKLFDEIARGDAYPINRYQTEMLWHNSEARSAMEVTGISSSVLPGLYEFKSLLGPLDEQIAYLNNARSRPKQLLYGLHNQYAYIAWRDLENIYQDSGYSLNISQVFDRLLRGQGDAPYNKLQGIDKRAIQADFHDYQVGPEQILLWHNIQRIKSHHTIIGRLLHQHAIEHNVFFNEESVNEYSTGTWSSINNMVSVRPHNHARYDHDYATGTVAHELLHAVQERRDVLEYSPHWSIKEHQIQVMSYEAAAMVTARLMAFELQMKGKDTGPWQSVAENNVSKAIEESFMRHIQGDAAYVEALEYAGAAAWQEVFKNQHWLDTYNKWVMKFYILRLQSGELSAQRYDEFSLSEARQDGFITKMFNATARIDRLPNRENLFGDNDTMRHLFDYLELTYRDQQWGKKNALYLAFKDRLEQQKNPFVGKLDISDLNVKGVSAVELYDQILCFTAVNLCKTHGSQNIPKV